jgi:hypothetical protein
MGTCLIWEFKKKLPWNQVLRKVLEMKGRNPFFPFGIVFVSLLSYLCLSLPLCFCFHSLFVSFLLSFAVSLPPSPPTASLSSHPTTLLCSLWRRS